MIVSNETRMASPGPLSLLFLLTLSKTVMGTGGYPPQTKRGQDDMPEATQTDSNIQPAVWNQLAFRVRSKIQLGKMKDNLMGSWQPGPNWAFSVPKASSTPAPSLVCACINKRKVLWNAVFGLPAESFLCNRLIHPTVCAFTHSYKYLLSSTKLNHSDPDINLFLS